MAVKLGATGIIVPATRSERIRRMREIVGGLRIATSCVGAQGGNAADTIGAGADYVIVGRESVCILDIVNSFDTNGTVISLVG